MLTGIMQERRESHGLYECTVGGIIKVKAGLNMLRVWGGGVFEENVFYDECDRLGILVAQDFLMACGLYPCEEEWFNRHLEKEALFAVKKLRNYACLVWWNGDNENAAVGSDDLKGYDGRKGVRGAIMPILRELDFKRNSFLSSPYGGELYASVTVGTTHNTQFMVPKYMNIRT
jgi:beta-mannosidase